MDCVEMNAYFNDQSYEYQTKIITMAEKSNFQLEKLALTFLLGGSEAYQQRCPSRWRGAKQQFIEVPLWLLMLLNYADAS